MAQQLQNITISAPAFKGLNTQDSPVEQDPSFASIAENCVIDEYGRIGARKGVEMITTTNTELGTDFLTVVHEYEDANGNLKVFSTGNSKILSGTTTLVDETPAAYTLTSENFQIVNFNDNCYFFCRDHEPLVYSTSLGAVTKMSAVAGYTGTAPQANAVCAAYGRLWAGDITGSPNMVYWSDLLTGQAWASGTSGSLNLDKVWPDGADKVVAVKAWNNLLVIFGKRSIVMYQGAESPATMTLADTISGIGCVDRDSIQEAGNDLLFMSERGVMSIGRALQDGSSPFIDVSKNVRDEIIRAWQLDVNGLKSAYSSTNGFYLLSFADSKEVYCFDLRTILEDGSYRVTKWTNTVHKCFFSAQDGTLYVGVTGGVAKYNGYTDLNNTYQMRYYSNPLSFGSSSVVKFLKKIVPTIIGGASVVFAIKWAYDFKTNYKSAVYTLGGAAIAEYGISEFGIAEYTAGIQAVAPRINATGSGNLVTIGLEATINGAALSLQEFNIQALMGRIY